MQSVLGLTTSSPVARGREGERGGERERWCTIWGDGDIPNSSLVNEQLRELNEICWKHCIDFYTIPILV